MSWETFVHVGGIAQTLGIVILWFLMREFRPHRHTEKEKEVLRADGIEYSRTVNGD